MQQTMIKHKTEMKQEKAQNNLKGLKKEEQQRRNEIYKKQEKMMEDQSKRFFENEAIRRAQL